MSALAEPPVTEPPVSPPTVVRDLAVVAAPAAPAAPAPPAPSDLRKVVIRLNDGETILVGVTPNLERAAQIAREWTKRLSADDGEWPRIGDRFIRPNSIVSVDVLKSS
ncbi:MAG TPA: hypothetical protein VNT58_04015 [Gaiellaceae bacterium]|nr:hypothetical protein [Gaiellaceae bacterium]